MKGQEKPKKLDKKVAQKSLKEKRAAKHQKQAETKQVRKGWEGQ